LSQEEWLTVDEIADRLKVHGNTVRLWIRSGELSAVNLGGSGYRVARSDLDRFLEARKLAA
jgi:excisionase family DNA binding protein